MLDEDDFEPQPRQERARWDDDDVPDEGESSYAWAEEHGPQPVPDWVITSGDARQDDIGTLKGGKEADVVLVERSHGDRTNILAAKRYRDTQHRDFRHDVAYRERRRGGAPSREQRAMARKTRFGMQVKAITWASNEMAMLCRLWKAGVPVPYPVQRLGTELMLEFIPDSAGTDDSGELQAAPRLVQVKPTDALAADAVDLLRATTAAEVIHGDLSPYNVLVRDGRLVAIDLPQAVDIRETPHVNDLLRRDVDNLLGWFVKKGVPVDTEAVFAELLERAMWGH